MINFYFVVPSRIITKYFVAASVAHAFFIWDVGTVVAVKLVSERERSERG